MSTEPGSPATPQLTPTSYLVLGLVAREGPSTPYDLKRHVAATIGHFWSFPHALLYKEPPRLAIRRGAMSRIFGGCLTMPAQRSGASKASADSTADEMEEGLPIMQQLLDNPFLLLFLGIALPTVLYIVWGVMEIITIPVAK